MTAAKNVKRRYKVEFPSENPSLLTEFHSRWRHCCLVVTFTAGLMSFVPECQTASNDVLSVIFVVITYIISDYNCGRVEMDLIKKEPEVDPLHLQAHSNTCEIEENKASSEEGKVSRLEVTGMKAECMDHSYEIKSEIKVEDTPLPTSVVFVKSEVDEDMFDVDRVQQEQKVEVSSEEDEVFPERCNEIIFPCTHKALKLFSTLPVTTATPGRSFSTLLYLKTYLRSRQIKWTGLDAYT
ncbi:uncharacterized protein [Periplaneta americana]|uniref:uncharacterized protein isoform X11 n=1 Tax=Periplaneta americana TaxID=6978 RepID=UPI0037E9381D